MDMRWFCCAVPKFGAQWAQAAAAWYCADSTRQAGTELSLCPRATLLLLLLPTLLLSLPRQRWAG